MVFIEWCDKHHVLLAIYPPHTTHRLQPLDVSLFSPLATYYTQQLETFIYSTFALSSLGKRDFFKLFWPAYINAFTEANINSGWQKTGLHPFNSELVISKLTQHSNGNKDELLRPGSNQSSGSSALSAATVRQVEQLIEKVANKVDSKNQKNQRKLLNTILRLQDKVIHLEHENKSLWATMNHKDNKKKLNKPLMGEFRAQEGHGAIIFLPAKIDEYRSLNTRREQKKDDDKAAKELVKLQQQQRKAANQLAALQRKEQRQQQLTERVASEVAAKAQKELVKEANNASKQLNNDLQSSTKKPKRQQHLLSIPQVPPISHNIEVVAGRSDPASQRPSRTKRAPPYLDGYQLN